MSVSMKAKNDTKKPPASKQTTSAEPSGLTRRRAKELLARGLGRGHDHARLDLIEVWIGRRGSPPEICHQRGLGGPPGRSP